MLIRIWRARACRITQARRDHKRAPVKPLAGSWVSPEGRPGYLGMCWVGSLNLSRMEIAQPLWAIHQCLTACMVKIDCSRSGSYRTTFLMSSRSLKRERSNLFCNREQFVWGTENFWYQRTDSHEKECKRWKETQGCLQLHSCLEMLVLQHKRFVFIVVNANRKRYSKNKQGCTDKNINVVAQSESERQCGGFNESQSILFWNCEFLSKTKQGWARPTQNPRGPAHPPARGLGHFTAWPFY